MTTDYQTLCSPLRQGNTSRTVSEGFFMLKVGIKSEHYAFQTENFKEIENLPVIGCFDFQLQEIFPPV